jgi:hypothetical protein
MTSLQQNNPYATPQASGVEAESSVSDELIAALPISDK